MDGYVSGTGGNDSITGNITDAFIASGSGNDTIDGGAGKDSLFGGDGNDRLLGSLGNDALFGGTGINNLQGFDLKASGATEVDTLFHSANSLNRFLLSDSGVNGYKRNGVQDYALIQGFTPARMCLLLLPLSLLEEL